MKNHNLDKFCTFQVEEVLWPQAVKFGDGIATDYNNLAVSLFNLGRIREATTYFKKCIEINNKAELPYQNLGTSYLHLGNYEQAIDCFTNALSLNNRLNNLKTIIESLIN